MRKTVRPTKTGLGESPVFCLKRRRQRPGGEKANHAVLISQLGCNGGFHLLDDRSKSSLVEHSHVSQHLAVEFDRSLLQAVDEHAVGHVVLTHRRVDTRDPQCAEHTLLVAAIAVGVLAWYDSTGC